ncbi:unnamed protein product [Mytilus edulis]|uniref:DZIP3-like HEPN domain-containing protein n=1 Tax=Mytilus edulis TaxID=6550 RepID=A0A8S3UJX3_MYTED|nr:unnamed protein product [Mytilus edulis]
MSDVLPSKKFLQLIEVLFDVSATVVREFANCKVIRLPEYSNSFIKFLDLNKHKLYHKWENDTPCCHCNNFKNLPHEMTSTKFYMLYQKISDRPIECIKRKGVVMKNGCIKQYCICNIIPQQMITLDDMDISMLAFLLRNSNLTESQVKCIDNLTELRNILCHARSTFSFPDVKLENVKTRLLYYTRKLARMSIRNIIHQ